MSSSLPPDQQGIQAGTPEPQLFGEIRSTESEQLPALDIRMPPSRLRNFIHSKIVWLLTGLTALGGGALLVKSAMEKPGLEQEDPKLVEFRKLIQTLVNDGEKVKNIQLAGPKADIVRDQGKIWAANAEKDGTVTVSVIPGMPGKRPQEKLWDKLEAVVVEQLEKEGRPKGIATRIATFHATWDPRSNRFTQVNVVYEREQEGAVGQGTLPVDEELNQFLQRRITFAHDRMQIEGEPDVLAAPDPHVPRKVVGE